MDEFNVNETVRLDEVLMNDYEAFLDYIQKDFDEAVEAVAIVKDLHTMFGHEFDIRILEE